MNMTSAPNWYADPANPQQERYWDGNAWTQDVRWRGAVPAFPVASEAPVSNSFSVSAIILGALAFVVFPPLFGTIGLVLGAVGMARKEPKAPLGMGIAAAGLILGMLLGMVVVGASMA